MLIECEKCKEIQNILEDEYCDMCYKKNNNSKQKKKKTKKYIDDYLVKKINEDIIDNDNHYKCYIKVPYNRKNEIKESGAQFDNITREWYFSTI